MLGTRRPTRSSANAPCNATACTGFPQNDIRALYRRAHKNPGRAWRRMLSRVADLQQGCMVCRPAACFRQLGSVRSGPPSCWFPRPPSRQGSRCRSIWVPRLQLTASVSQTQPGLMYPRCLSYPVNLPDGRLCLCLGGLTGCAYFWGAPAAHLSHSRNVYMNLQVNAVG